MTQQSPQPQVIHQSTLLLQLKTLLIHQETPKPHQQASMIEKKKIHQDRPPSPTETPSSNPATEAEQLMFQALK